MQTNSQFIVSNKWLIRRKPLILLNFVSYYGKYCKYILLDACFQYFWNSWKFDIGLFTDKLCYCFFQTITNEIEFKQIYKQNVKMSYDHQNVFSITSDNKSRTFTDNISYLSMHRNCVPWSCLLFKCHHFQLFIADS